jgi:anti-sigma B factor antagonist
MEATGASQRLTFGYRLDQGIAVVQVTGELDLSTCGALRDSLLRVVTDEERRGLVVNLSGVTFIDSTGIGVLVGVWHRVRASNHRMALAELSVPVARILETAGLTTILPAYPDDAQAVEAVRESAT